MVITNRKNIKWLIVLIIAAIVFLASATLLIMHLLPDRENFGDYKNSSDVSGSQNDKQEVVLADNPINFSALKADNPDVCAWIKIDGTVIDYPILRSGEDTEENFYLNHDLNRVQKKAGSLYIQRINAADFSDANTVIYGHNMLNGSMFGQLKKFRNTKFFNENSKITVYTPGHILNYKILSSFVYNDCHILNTYRFYVEEEFAAFLEDCKNPPSAARNIRPDLDVTTSDRIITLSTCTNVDSERYLVVAVLTEDIPTK